MSRILRGVIVYTFILAAAAAVLGVFLFGIMFITSATGKPFKVFGYKAIYSRNARSAEEITTSSFDKGSILNLTIKSGNHKVLVKQAGDSTTNIIVQKSDSMVGIIKGYDGKIEKTISVDEETGVISATISIKNAEGIVSYGESFLLVYVPDAKEFKINLSVETVNGNVVIDGATQKDAAAKIALNSLSVKTVKGSMEVKQLGSIFGVEQADSTTSNATLAGIYLNTKGGNFVFSSVENLRVVSGETLKEIEEINEDFEKDETSEFVAPEISGDGVIEIEAAAGDFIFKNIYSQMKVFGEQIRIEAADIVVQGEGFKFNAPKGYLKIRSIFTQGNEEEVANVINTEVINVDIQEITGYTNIKTTMGSIKINTINGSATLQSRNGNITVGEVVTGNMSAVTQFGNINIKGYKQAAYFESTKGDITATSLQEEGSIFQTEVKTNDGSVALNTIAGMLKLAIKGNGSAKVNFIDLVQNADNLVEIVNARGKINLVVKSSPFFLIAKGSVVGDVFTTNIANLVKGKEGQKVSVLTTSSASPLMDINAGNGKVTFSYNIGE